MKIVVRVKLTPQADQAAALSATLHEVNEAANWVSAVAFEHGVPREYELRKYAYAELRSRGLGAQAAQHIIKKTRDAYTTLKANIKAWSRPAMCPRLSSTSRMASSAWISASPTSPPRPPATRRPGAA